MAMEELQPGRPSIPAMWMLGHTALEQVRDKCETCGSGSLGTRLFGSSHHVMHLLNGFADLSPSLFETLTGSTSDTSVIPISWYFS